MYTKLLHIYLAKIHQAIEADRAERRPDELKLATMACLCFWSKLICWKYVGSEGIGGIQILIGLFGEGTHFSPWLPVLCCVLLWNRDVGETHEDLKDVGLCL